MTSVGLEDWVASSFEDYVERAAEMARQPDRLAGLRAGLRNRVASSPLTDAAAFSSHLEEAYRRMWRRWCGGSPS
jgi:predicted O-linked N-acetylglucosamine transferase (SPINDLY family)